ncbi:hypothetical protein SPLC1_S500050 [Arthrospira platensis C1]|uniref:Uncharacterized protein n=3 Tax=Limnospira TaxID=2596745 RepID=A0A9P1KGP1_9CYAN|nr:hypothetical protein AmaxDRAFT_0633 [Limnospira maxima CS-328]EKD07029.1 hypothetical protein SPLC1_S500050 [Arthrospira platensis C1]CDM95926.1 hypothetical protein ARTHRO_40332 [Limnospira indica PCC 8005]BDT15849.1 hypothetical protein N39L_55720 [Arthrospira platensis NIES-39]GCE96193.1 hypothetical protein NIES46_42610 [Arthrospira platensis NIES-46]
MTYQLVLAKADVDAPAEARMKVDMSSFVAGFFRELQVLMFLIVQENL